jgi:hypothetical protein
VEQARLAEVDRRIEHDVGLNPAQIQANIQNPPGTMQNPHVIVGDENAAREQFDTYVKPGQAYRNPRDGKIYIRKVGDHMDDDAPDTAVPASAPAAARPIDAGAAAFAASFFAMPTTSHAFSPEAQQMCTGDAFRLCSSEIPNSGNLSLAAGAPVQTAELPALEQTKLQAPAPVERPKLVPEEQVKVPAPVERPAAAEKPRRKHESTEARVIYELHLHGICW